MLKRKIEIILDIQTGECEIYLECWSQNKHAIATLKNVIKKLEETGGEKVTVIISDSPELNLEDLRKPVEQWPAEQFPSDLQPVEEPEEMFYIQDGYIGNSVCWWRLKSQGRTEDLDFAQKYTKEDASKTLEHCSGKGLIAWPCDYIDNNEAANKRTIDSQYLDSSFSLKSIKFETPGTGEMMDGDY